MKKFAIALILLFALSTVASFAQARRPLQRRVFHRWAVRVQNLATRRIRNINVNATTEMAARRRAVQIARTKWRPAHRGFRVISARRIR